MPRSNAPTVGRASPTPPLGSKLPTPSRSALTQSMRQERPPLTRGGNKHRKEPFDVNKNKSIAINKKIVALGEAQDWEGMLGVFVKDNDAFDSVNYSTVMVQLSKQALAGETEHITQHPRFNLFLDSLADKIVEQRLEWIGVRQAANVIHAFAKMGLCNERATRILDWISKKENAEQFIDTAKTTQDVANTAWAFATLGTPAPAFFSRLDDESDWLFNSGYTQHVANVAWAYAKLKTTAPTFFSKLDAESGWFFKNATPQNIANVAWACATLDTPVPAFFAKLETASEWFVKTGNAQNIANVAWAFFANLDSVSEWFVKTGNQQNMANVAWACAKLKTPAPTFFSNLDAESDWFFRNGTPQEISSVAWACAKLKTPAPIFFSKFGA